MTNMNRKSKLVKLATEAEVLANELVRDNFIKFRHGLGIINYLLSRCGYYDSGLTIKGHKYTLPKPLREAVQTLVIANDSKDDERRPNLITALYGLSRVISIGLAHASGMCDAISDNQQ